MAQGRETPSNRSNKTERISALSNGVINTFTDDTVTNYAGLMSNVVGDIYSNDKDRMYATQRPALTIYRKAAATVADTKGRGIHHWSSNGGVYFMNDDILYKGNYATACSVQGGDTAIASGSQKVYFREWSSANADYLFIIDPENAGIYVISSLLDTTVINLVDRTGTGTLEGFAAGDGWDFDALNAIIATDGLCDGAVDLDTYLFLGTKTSARVYNSNVDDWLNWNALNFLTCERSNDQLLFIEKSKEHIVAFGASTIEMMYDNKNLTGSPLAIRTDISHRVGIAFGETAWTNGDDIHFLALLSGGAMALSTLKDFQVVPHANTTMNAFLWQSRYTEDLTMTMSGFSVGDHVYAILTMLDAGVVEKSITYDYTYDLWYEWSTTIGNNVEFPIMGYSSERHAPDITRPSGILRTGDVFLVSTDYVPIDTITETGQEESVNIPISIITDNYDANSSDDKFMYECKYAGNQPAASAVLTVAWTDDDGVTSNSQTIDLADRTQINRMGRFVKRKFTLSLAAAEQIRMEGIDVGFTQGSN